MSARSLASSAHGRAADADRLLNFVLAAGAAGRRLRALLEERVRRFDLSEAECLILWLCATQAHHAGSSQQDLAGAVGVSPAQMSSLVERLRKRGLMEMTRSPIDRRRQVWRLLAQGEELLDQIRTSLGAVAEEIDGLITPQEQQAAQLMLARLSEPAPFYAPVLRTFDPDGMKASLEITASEVQGGGQ